MIDRDGERAQECAEAVDDELARWEAVFAWLKARKTARRVRR